VLDLRLRPLKERLVEPIAAHLARHVSANALTTSSLLVTLGAAALAASSQPIAALGAWLVGRTLDGLDGPVARHRGAASDVGGYLDMVADTIGYAAVPIGVAFGVDDRTTWIAASVLLGTFFVNTISWSYLAAVLEKRGAGASSTGEMTSITMPPALIEGTETIVIFGLFLALPQWAAWIFGAMAIGVAINVVQRLVWAGRALPNPATTAEVGGDR
jgi:phosphatidylglycerophosphate synthase